MPVVVLEGDRHAARVAAGLVRAAGMPEICAASEADFVARAVALISDRPRLLALRTSLRDGMRASPLMDDRGYASRVHAALRDCWRQWCAGQTNGE